MQQQRTSSYVRRAVVLAIVTVLLFVALATLGHAVTEARFYVPSSTDEPLAWIWRLSAVMFAGALLLLGASLVQPWTQRAGWPALLVGLALAAAPLCFVLTALGWSDDAMPQELLATQVFSALHLLSLAAAITGAVIASRRAVSTDA